MELFQNIHDKAELESSSRELGRVTGNAGPSLWPQWANDVYDWTYSLVKKDLLVDNVVRPDPVEDCAGCHLTKKMCNCGQCAVCHAAVRRGRRHHCRRCWRPICNRCWPRSRHVRLLEKPVKVCDSCAVPWALASLFNGNAKRLFWGLYILSRAAEMPRLCVDPSCGTLTYLGSCYSCRCPTVMTQPHSPRVIDHDAQRLLSVDRILLLDIYLSSLRSGTVDAYSADEIERSFFTYFKNFEDGSPLKGVTSTQQAQDILLSLVCTGISYEYNRAPNISLALSDISYAHLLKINSAHPRYTIMEAPGKVKFIAFPGTHDWRTLWINFNASQTSKAFWTPLVESIVIPTTGVDHNGNNSQSPIRVCGSMCKVWEYKVHSGFAQEAKEVGFSLDLLARDLQSGYRLVLTGHSLGGAVAQLLTLQLLDQFLEMGKSPQILCVTIGAPLIGNYQLAQRVERNGWTRYFHNIVYRSDIVPRLACGSELTWRMAAQVLGRASVICQSLRNWFSWKENNPQVSSERTTPDIASDPNNNGGEMLEIVSSPNELQNDSVRRESIVWTGKAHVGASSDFDLIEYVDKSIRTERDVLEDDEKQPPSPINMSFGTAQVQPPTSSSHSTHHDGAGNSAVKLGDIGKEDCAHRRYACFGRYHFFEYCAEGYFSTKDSEVAFGLLKRGCNDNTVDLQDHTMTSYNRCIMLRLCGKRKDM
ncbi:unnamed protein product [Phytomonas sp. Hart1]|nr:unnamed protein product [Phytomonas sp. Hart1]|eukprot:CCW66855.1 unnamed protein product [Phytomonas sp. isolate Hart1]